MEGALNVIPSIALTQQLLSANITEMKRAITWSLALCIFCLLCTCDAEEGGSLGICIRNCGQCKRMYGEFFLGQQCAEECVQTRGLGTLPDCNNPKSLFRFLGKT